MKKRTKGKDKVNQARIHAYIRVSTVKQDLDNQVLEINHYCEHEGLKVDHWIKKEISSRRGMKDRGIDELLEGLKSGDTLIVSELSRLGRSLKEILEIVNELIKKHVRFIAIKQSMIINGRNDMATKVIIAMFGLLAEIERDLISERTKNGLARAKASGKRLGNPRFDLDNRRNREEAQAYAESLRPILEGFNGQGMSQRQMVAEFNKLGVKARRGGKWSLLQLQHVLKRLGIGERG
jgi:DNA invertase Pin-like site-specific DNA recombinase